MAPGPGLFFPGILSAFLLLAPGSRAQPWQQNDTIFNPSGIPSLSFSQPRFANLDGDLDLAVGNYDGTFNYYQNMHATFVPYQGTDQQPAESKRVSAYPNPFNRSTVLSGSVPEEGKLVLSIFNILGQRVYHRSIDHIPAGDFHIRVQLPQHLATGVYHHAVSFAGRNESFRNTGKMAYLK